MSDLLNPCRKCGHELGRTVQNLCRCCKHNPSWEPSAVRNHLEIFVGDVNIGRLQIPESYERAKGYDFWDALDGFLLARGYS